MTSQRYDYRIVCEFAATSGFAARFFHRLGNVASMFIGPKSYHSAGKVYSLLMSTAGCWVWRAPVQRSSDLGGGDCFVTWIRVIA